MSIESTYIQFLDNIWEQHHSEKDNIPNIPVPNFCNNGPKILGQNSLDR